MILIININDNDYQYHIFSNKRFFWQSQQKITRIIIIIINVIKHVNIVRFNSIFTRVLNSLILLYREGLTIDRLLKFYD
jgi:hypothetical protein